MADPDGDGVLNPSAPGGGNGSGGTKDGMFIKQEWMNVLGVEGFFWNDFWNENLREKGYNGFFKGAVDYINDNDDCFLICAAGPGHWVTVVASDNEQGYEVIDPYRGSTMQLGRRDTSN